MAKQRKPQQVVLYIELEDNVGYVLGKKKLEIPLSGDNIPEDIEDGEVAKMFNTFVSTLQKHLESQ